jgi:hypothetical protein
MRTKRLGTSKFFRLWCCGLELIGLRFYYADERKPDGSPKYKVDGDAHAELYWDLAQDSNQREWMQTFVKDKGYVDFDGLYTPTKPYKRG